MGRTSADSLGSRGEHHPSWVQNGMETQSHSIAAPICTQHPRSPSACSARSCSHQDSPHGKGFAKSAKVAKQSETSGNHFVIESQNHRMAWVEKDHNAHPVPTPCYVQGRQPPGQAAQSHIQPGLECLQGWGIHSVLGQPVQCISTLWGKNFLLISNLNLPCLSTCSEHQTRKHVVAQPCI